MRAPVEGRLLVEHPDEVEIQPARKTLVGHRRVQMAIAKDVRSGSERRLHQLANVLRPVRDVEQELREGVDARDVPAEQETA